MDTAPAPPPAGNSTTEQATEYLKFLWKWRKYLLLLAMLVASVTYAAGLNPPGGVRSDEAPAPHQKRIGDPVLLATSPRRYAAFFYCNAAAFVASLVVIMFLLDRRISGNRVGLAVLNSAMLLDLLALVAAFIAGSCRNLVASIYVSALFALVFAIPCVYRDRRKAAVRTSVDKFLMLLSTFATPLTYGAGLSPPGGFWSQTEAGHRAGAPLLHDGPYKIRYNVFFYANANSFVASLAIIMLVMSRTASGSIARSSVRSLITGDPVLLDHYRIRYQVFFYCNATGFMASITTIFLLVNQKLNKQGFRSNALQFSVMVGLLGPVGAYAVGSCRQLHTSIFVFALVAAVVVVLIMQILLIVMARIFHCLRMPWLPKGLFEPLVSSSTWLPCKNKSNNERYVKRKYLMLVGILGASMNYQAGLAPPGGTWGDDDNASSPSPSPSAHPLSIGNSILLNSNPTRHQVFFYCNATSFMASIIVIILLMQYAMKLQRAPLWVLQAVVVLDLLSLLGAYAAGSCRDWETSVYVIMLAAALVIFIAIYVLLFDDMWRKYFSDTKRMVWKYLTRSNGSDQSVAAGTPV